MTTEELRKDYEATNEYKEALMTYKGWMLSNEEYLIKKGISKLVQADDVDTINKRIQRAEDSAYQVSNIIDYRRTVGIS